MLLLPLTASPCGEESWKHRGDRRGWEWGRRYEPPKYSPTSSKEPVICLSLHQKQKPLHNGISMYAFCLRGPVNEVDCSNIAMTEIHLGGQSR
jgi:hypothetical protein